MKLQKRHTLSTNNINTQCPGDWHNSTTLVERELNVKTHAYTHENSSPGP